MGELKEKESGSDRGEPLEAESDAGQEIPNEDKLSANGDVTNPSGKSTEAIDESAAEDWVDEEDELFSGDANADPSVADMLDPSGDSDGLDDQQPASHRESVESPDTDGETEWQDHEAFLESLDDDNGDVDYSGALGDLMDDDLDASGDSTEHPSGRDEITDYHAHPAMVSDSIIEKAAVGLASDDPFMADEDNFFAEVPIAPINEPETESGFAEPGGTGSGSSFPADEAETLESDGAEVPADEDDFFAEAHLEGINEPETESGFAELGGTGSGSSFPADEAEALESDGAKASAGKDDFFAEAHLDEINEPEPESGFTEPGETGSGPSFPADEAEILESDGAKASAGEDDFFAEAKLSDENEPESPRLDAFTHESRPEEVSSKQSEEELKEHETRFEGEPMAADHDDSDDLVAIVDCSDESATRNDSVGAEQHSFAEDIDPDDNDDGTDRIAHAGERLLTSSQSMASSRSVPVKGDRSMKWFAIAVPATLLLMIIVGGGILYHLQSEVDELRSMIPEEQEEPDELFSDSGISPGATDSVNDAVIENIHARIDNIADTLELVVNTERSEPGSPEGAAINRMHPLKPEFSESRIRQMIGESLSNDPEIRNLSTRIDTLAKSVETLKKRPQRSALQAKEIRPGQPPLRPVEQKRAIPKENRPDSSRKKAVSGAVKSESKRAVTLAAVPDPVTRTGGVWVVNLMSLKDKKVAEKQLQGFQKKGVEAVILPARVKGKRWFRIQVQGFNTRKQAQKYAKSVQSKLALPGTWVTR